MAATNFEYTKKIMSNAITRTEREKRIVMFHIGRSGSTVLGSLFNQNKDIFWDSEIFMRNRMPSTLRPLTRPIFSFPSLVVRTRMMRTAKPIYGFEAKLAHIGRVGRTMHAFVDEMQSLGFDHFIVLRRRNQLRAIISHNVAKQKGYWHRNGQIGSSSGGLAKIDTGQAEAPSKVKVDVNHVDMGSVYNEQPCSLIEHIASTDRHFEQLHQLLDQFRVLELIYEEHIEQNPANAYLTVCKFLDIQPSTVEIELKKTNPWPVKDLVSNYDELVDVLAGSPYEWMLEA